MFPLLTVVDQSGIEVIHEASLEILRDTGVQFPDTECLSALADAGAYVDRGAQTARLPARLVENALARCSRQYALFGRDPRRMARFGAGDLVFVSSPGQFGWVDDDGGERRDPTVADLRAAALVGDALEHIDIVGGLAMPLDVPAGNRDVLTAAELVKATSKVTHVWIAGGRTLHSILDIYEAVRGGEAEHRRQPMMQGFIEPVSPLRFAPNGLEILKICARKGLPLCFGPMVQAGATGPATLAGTLAVENAEILAGVVLAELFGEGVGVCYGGIPHIFDMRTTQISFGAPEQGLMAVAMIQMARHYGLPSYVNVGLSDSKLMDAQSGFERGTSLLLGALAGADTFGHMGIVGPDQAGSLEQLICDNEIAACVKRIIRGFEVNSGTLALGVVKQVGIGGSFLGEEHTRAHYRSESWLSALFDRQRWEPWKSSGSKSIWDRAHERKLQILAHHTPSCPIDFSLSREIDRISGSDQDE
jgi:trimethylamine--corrinoid protein Co-methyltransferase